MLKRILLGVSLTATLSLAASPLSYSVNKNGVTFTNQSSESIAGGHVYLDFFKAPWHTQQNRVDIQLRPLAPGATETIPVHVPSSYSSRLTADRIVFADGHKVSFVGTWQK